MKLLGKCLLLVTILYSVFSLLSSLQPVYADTPGTMADYWAGNAHWKFVRKYTQANQNIGWGFGLGSHIYIKDGNWYWFRRHIYWAQTPWCPSGKDGSGVDVLKSTDQGVTWSAPVPIVSPTQGSPWECTGGDGDVIYNATENKWHYLMQCINRTGPWNGCEIERSGPDPMGPFTQNPQVPNPVIPGSSIWGQICDSQTDDCVQIPGGTGRVHDEGTFEFISYQGGYYYVGFHGADNSTAITRGYRSIAKTNDFLHWIANDPAQGVPNDAIFDLKDALNWRETWNAGGPIGGGAARTYFENGYYYMIIESADITLNCAPDQNWDYGILRSSSLTNTKWEQFPLGNPIIYSSHAIETSGQDTGHIRPCNIQYQQIFQDPGTQKIYLWYDQDSPNDPNFDGRYLYELVNDGNLLKNADFWTCSVSDWIAVSPGANQTSMTAIRNPKKSSDGNCYMEASCAGSSCNLGQGVFQDFTIPNTSQRWLQYGAKLALDPGFSGSVNLVSFEYDNNGTVVTSHLKNFNLTSSYQLYSTQVNLNPATTRARFGFYLNTPNTVSIDETFATLFASSPSFQLNFQVKAPNTGAFPSFLPSASMKLIDTTNRSQTYLSNTGPVTFNVGTFSFSGTANFNGVVNGNYDLLMKIGSSLWEKETTLNVDGTDKNLNFLSNPPVTLGDLNNDNKIDVLDMAKMSNFLTASSIFITQSNNPPENLNMDTIVDSNDVTVLRNNFPTLQVLGD